MMTNTIYRKVNAGILRVELLRSTCGTPFTRETLLRTGTRPYRAALAMIEFKEPSDAQYMAALGPCGK